jgi:hypothetical protein
MRNIIHFGKKPLPPCYEGWRRVLLDGNSVADIRGAILRRPNVVLLDLDPGFVARRKK